MKQETKEENKPITIRFKPSLMKKIEQYLELVNSTKGKRNYKLTKVEFFNDLVANFFNGKVLNNDYIRLDKPFYFNYMDLLKNSSVECSLTKPTTDLNSTCIIKNVPNNLDKIIRKKNLDTTTRYVTYGFENNLNKHKGIVFSSFDGYKDSVKYLVFELNKYTGSISHETETKLKISILEHSELFDYLDISKEKNIINQLHEAFEQYTIACEEAINVTKEFEAFCKNNKKEDIHLEINRKFKTRIIKTLENRFIWDFINFKFFISNKLHSTIKKVFILAEKNAESNENFKEIEKKLLNSGTSKVELEHFFNTFEIEFSLQVFFAFLNVLDVDRKQGNDILLKYLKE